MGLNDDWPYIWSARLLAEAGHIRYNGGASAMLGWQLYLGALFHKIFWFLFFHRQNRDAHYLNGHHYARASTIRAFWRDGQKCHRSDPNNRAFAGFHAPRMELYV
jgi:hypothetical protein